MKNAVAPAFNSLWDSHWLTRKNYTLSEYISHLSPFFARTAGELIIPGSTECQFSSDSGTSLIIFYSWVGLTYHPTVFVVFLSNSCPVALPVSKGFFSFLVPTVRLIYSVIHRDYSCNNIRCVMFSLLDACAPLDLLLLLQCLQIDFRLPSSILDTGDTEKKEECTSRINLREFPGK